MKTLNNAADQPKRTLLTGFDSFDYTAQDYTPKYLDSYLYCHSIDKEFLSKGFLPRCPLLEKVLNDTATSFDDIYYPPKFTKPPQPKSHSEYKVSAISQLISVLNWWVRENVNDPKLLCFYAYSYGPCKRRTVIGVGGNALDNLITEFNYSHPAIAAELKELASNLVKKAIDWDAHTRLVQQSQCWIDPSCVNPVEVKEVAAALLDKLRHIGSLVREQTADLQRQTDLAKQAAERERDIAHAEAEKAGVNINIGAIQAEIVQIAKRASIHTNCKTQPRRKFSILGWIRKILCRPVGAIVGALIVAILVAIFADLGWLEQIKTFVYRILQLK